MFEQTAEVVVVEEPKPAAKAAPSGAPTPGDNDYVAPVKAASAEEPNPRKECEDKVKSKVLFPNLRKCEEGGYQSYDRSAVGVQNCQAEVRRVVAGAVELECGIK